METVDLIKPSKSTIEARPLQPGKWTLQHYKTLLGSKAELQSLLRLDDLNFAYFFQLLSKKENRKSGEDLVLFDPSKKQEGVLAYSTAVAPRKILEKLPLTQVSSLLDPKYRKAAERVTVWRKKMHAGIGSTILRGSHLKKHRPSGIERPGAKGCDLFVPLSKKCGFAITKPIPLAEILLLQGILEAKRKEYLSILFHDIVSLETEAHFAEFWGKLEPIENRSTYSEYVKKSDRLGRTHGIKQSMVPTIDEAGHFSLNRMAPAGHALFAFEALTAALCEDSLPKAPEDQLVCFISNGEDISASPSPQMVGWMVEENTPIAMVVTEKTRNDIKGGQIALVESPSHGTYVTIVESAQAKNANQQDLFERLGLDIRLKDQPAYFNTNMVLINYKALKPRVRELVKLVGEDTFLQRIAPDLIENWKEQTDTDGIKRRYLQLEGAMGSTLLNLDKLHRENFKTPLVHFLGVNAKERDQYFSPVKTAFDFFQLFFSDRFTLDPVTLKPVNHRPGEITQVSFCGDESDPHFWDDVENVLSSFENTSILHLDSLKVKGIVSFKGLTLKGKIEVSNAGGRLELPPLLKTALIKDSRIHISKDREVKIEPV